MLEVMQCGLSRGMMLKKREIFRSCFDGFDYDRIAEYTEADIERILNTEGMIRSRRKIEAVIWRKNRLYKLRETVEQMFDDIFKRKKVVLDRLIMYGFRQNNSIYQYTRDIRDGEFSLTVSISLDGKVVDTELIERESGEPYVLYKTNATGTYVGEIRTAIEGVLREIASNCYEDAVFQSEQAEMAIQYVRETYSDELEFLWTKFPDNAIWRRKDNAKWYGAILTVIGNKIGLDTDKIVEIIDLRMNPKDAEAVLSREHYLPGWHMNKKSWYTIVLDGSIPDEELKARIDESYVLAGESK